MGRDYSSRVAADGVEFLAAHIYIYIYIYICIHIYIYIYIYYT